MAIKITKHGSLFHRSYYCYEVHCKTCGCEFKCTSGEMGIRISTSQHQVYHLIRCPECLTEINETAGKLDGDIHYIDD